MANNVLGDIHNPRYGDGGCLQPGKSFGLMELRFCKQCQNLFFFYQKGRLHPRLLGQGRPVALSLDSSTDQREYRTHKLGTGRVSFRTFFLELVLVLVLVSVECM